MPTDPDWPAYALEAAERAAPQPSTREERESAEIGAWLQHVADQSVSIAAEAQAIGVRLGVLPDTNPRPQTYGAALRAYDGALSALRLVMRARGAQERRAVRYRAAAVRYRGYARADAAYIAEMRPLMLENARRLTEALRHLNDGDLGALRRALEGRE